MSIEIKINNKDLILLSYYNPPDIQLSGNVFAILSQQKKDYCIIGDLNAKSKAIGCANQNNNGFLLEKNITRLYSITNQKTQIFSKKR